MWNKRCAGAFIIPLLLNFSSASYAEYVIYLKGGHYVAADNCTFLVRRERVQGGDAEKEGATIVQVEDCAKQKPEEKLEGRIFWSTIDGKFGELNAEDVYYIYGSKNIASITPLRPAKPLEDYLIVNRGDSFINAKVVSESEGRVYGVKRDDLADINRRGVTEIVPLADAKSRSGEGLCPGEGAEFDVTETDYALGNFVGTFKNLSRESCMEATFEVEVKENETFVDKFQVRDSSAVSPGRSKHISKEVPAHLREYVKRFKNREGGVQLCWTKVQSSAQCQAEVRK
jgi:hypothetical protein